MKRIRDATQIIARLDNGEAAEALSDEIRETVLALEEQVAGRKGVKAKGKVTLSLEIVVENGTATITPSIDAKRPKPVRGGSFFWLLSDGSLTDEHPKQQDMFPREVPARREAEAGD